MSLKGSKKLETNRYELDITISGESFSDAIKKVYQKNVKKISVPGFRKGKAPLSIIESMYGESFFYEDALNLLYADAVEEAAKEAGLTIIDDKMDFDLKSISKKDGVEFTVALTVKPEVEVSEYKGLKAERVKPVVTDEELQSELDALAERNSRMVAVEGRAAENGDTAVIDFDGYLDGKQFDGGKSEGYSLVLGSGQFIPGFEDQIIGHNAGDEFDVNVTFPEDYGAKDLAGKPVVFKVKLHEIKVKELPKIDDEFAKDVSEFDTIDELRADNKEKALKRKEQAADDDVENQLIEQLIDGLKGEIPEAMYNNRVEQSVRDFEYRLQMQGMNLDTYLQYTGAKLDDLKLNMRPQAEKQVKIRLALEKIAQLEDLKPTDEELEEEYKKLADGYKIDVERVKNAIPAEEVSADLAVKKAIDFVKSNAEIKEVDKKTEKKEEKTESKTTSAKTTAKKAPAKKPAAKKEDGAKEEKAETKSKPAAKTASTAKKAPAKKTTSTKSTAAKKPAAEKKEEK